MVAPLTGKPTIVQVLIAVLGMIILIKLFNSKKTTVLAMLMAVLMVHKMSSYLKLHILYQTLC